MDLGIMGKSALVCTASKSLGRACAVSLAGEGVNLAINNPLPGPFATDRLKGTVESVAAPSYAARRQALSPGRTSCSMAAPSRAPCDGARFS